MSVTLDYSLYPVLDLSDILDVIYGPDFSDTFTPTTNATPICFESRSGKPCGMSYPRVGVDSPGRVVFLSFPLDAVPFRAPRPITKSLSCAISLISLLRVPTALGPFI